MIDWRRFWIASVNWRAMDGSMVVVMAMFGLLFASGCLLLTIRDYTF